MRYLKLTDCEFTLECEPCQEAIEGNCSAIDDETDAATARWIRNQLNRGNEWAWCDVVVRARFRGFEATASLGCCSYLSESDFRADAYFADLKLEAFEALNAAIGQAAAS